MIEIYLNVEYFIVDLRCGPLIMVGLIWGVLWLKNGKGVQCRAFLPLRKTRSHLHMQLGHKEEISREQLDGFKKRILTRKIFI